MPEPDDKAATYDEPALQLIAERGLFYPMDEFYETLGAPLPPVYQVDGKEVPEPYRSLLVHQRDMTPTLTDAHRQPLRLRILQLVITDSFLRRMIVLEVEKTGRPVVFAAITIYLDRFASEPRRLILEGKLAFGAILHGQSIAHASRPVGFFRVEADSIICEALHLAQPAELFGRTTVMLDHEQQPLAHVLEVLPSFRLE